MTWDVFYGSPVIADMDKDGYWEIVVTGIPEQWSGNRRTLVCMYEHTGALKWRWDQTRNNIPCIMTRPLRMLTRITAWGFSRLTTPAS